MDQVAGIIKREIANQEVFFVFPSDVAAGLWARRAGEFAGPRSLATDRFMAWDRFKEQVVLAEAPGREPASSVIRKLFAEQLVKKNAEEKFLQSLIPREYAESGGVFTASIAALLPALGYWDRRLQKTESYTADAEDRDFMFVKTKYAAFLEENGLFEPSWQELTIRDQHKKYFIFFPEIMEDYGEYEELLEHNRAFEIIRRAPDGPPPELRWYASVRGEIRAMIREIRRLHETEGVPYEDMAVNVPQLDELAPYLQREFFLYDIPFRLGAGKPLAEYGAGRLFSLIQNCVSNNFSFAALKTLLLNIHLPWARPDRNRELIEFGVSYNCLSPFRENGRTVDIWQAAFTGAREELLRQYYEGLKKELSALVKAKSFSDIRRFYFAFRNSSLDMSKCGVESDNVLARCIEELSVLIRLEEEYPRLVPETPFAFFVSVLGETKYVPDQKKQGVNIFPYRVAAAAPFRCHFVLNASQAAASVVYRPLGFLRQDKRRNIGLNDADVSGDFFCLYRAPSPADKKGRSCYSASAETLAGPAIPHSFFAAGRDGGTDEPGTPREDDPFYLEKSWWAAGAYAAISAALDRAEFPPRLFPVQREGFQNWSSLLRGGRKGRFNLLAEQFPASWPSLPLLRQKIHAAQWEQGPETAGSDASKLYFRVSATGLNSFFYCSVFWFFERILNIREYSLEAELMDDKALGILYHEILKNLFQKIHDRDRRFLPEHLKDYRLWAEEFTEEAAKKFRAFQGPLAVPLLSAQARPIALRIARLLETEAAYFPRYTVGDLERKFSRVRQINGIPVLFTGKLDRVSVSEDDEPVIIDYKINIMPSKAGSAVGEDQRIENYQMAMYVSLLEEAAASGTGGAYFMSIKQNDITAVIGKPKRKRGFSREEFQPTLDALETAAGRFVEAVDNVEFAPRPLDRKTCRDCGYKKICRTAYFLNPEPGNAGELTAEAVSGEL
ncbi:MAG: PD-(D/E)XK nuclease family protein [Treponema sp.]|jgi:RecB family exonuclease|nr:PD-(D/E)XK nuclease family protein [Treponema sp.]